jgi:hypothetical protein
MAVRDAGRAGGRDRRPRASTSRPRGLTWPELVDDLFSKVVEPTLVQPTVRH